MPLHKSCGSDLPQIYVGEITKPEVARYNFTYFHGFGDTAVAFSYDGLSREFLQGHLHGATISNDCKWIPGKYLECFNYEVKPLSESKFKRLIEELGLLENIG